MEKIKHLLKFVVPITGVVFLTKILGFVRQVVIAGAFGTTIETDLISLSEGLTVNIEYVLIQTLITAIVPIYLGIKAKSSAEANVFISNSIVVFETISLLLSSFIIVFAPFISKIIAPSYDADLSDKLTGYIRLFSPLFMPFCLQAIFHALLNANENYIPGQLIGINQSVILILLVLLFGPKLGPKTIALGFLVYPLFNALYLGFCSHKLWKFQTQRPIFNENICSLFRMMGPLCLGYAMVFINQQVDKIIVSGMEPGTITAMGFGQSLSNFVATMIGAFSTIVCTKITKLVVNGRNEEASHITLESICLMTTLFLPVSIIAAINSREVVSMVFQRGSFNQSAVEKTSKALCGYVFMYVPHIAKILLNGLHYGYKDTRHPMINNSIGILVNIVLSLLLYKPFGVFGVTLSSSIAELSTSILNIVSARKVGLIKRFQIPKCYVIIWLIGVVLCVIISVSGHMVLTEIDPIIKFLLIVAFTFSVYMVIAYYVLQPRIRAFLKN